MHSSLRIKDFIKSYFSGGVIFTLLFLISFVSNTFADGNDDFSTLKTNNGYSSATTTNGWQINNAAVVEIDNTVAPTINGKTSAKGTITSPTLKGGCGTLSLKYANTFKENNGVDFSLTIKQDGKDDVTYRITNKDVTQNSIYSWEENINISGDFTIYIINNSPSNSTSNKDRVSIWNITWTGYTENPTKCNQPIFSPENGTTFSESLIVKASTTTENAKIVYTTNESDVLTAGSTPFPTEGLTITETTTIRAMAVMEDGSLENSEVATATYTKTKKAVTLNFEQNEYTVDINTTTTVKATTDKPNASIKYTTDADENVCIIDESTGEVIAGNTPATVTITATIDEDNEYERATATCTLKIVDPNAVEYTDILTYKLYTETSSTTYNDFNSKSAPSPNSGATYSGYAASDKASIQLRTKNSESGIIASNPGKRLKKVIVEWNTATDDTRILDIYGKETAYSSAKELYQTTGNNNQGNKLGSINKKDQTELELKGNYSYIGLRSNNGALYINKLTLIWEDIKTEEISITFTKSVYTTYVAPCDIEFPADLSGYIVTDVTENSVITEEIATAPMGTPVIIKAKELGTYNLIKAEEVIDYVTSNKLHASDGTITGGNNIYAMAVKSKGAGFYKVAETVTIPKGKAYLVWENAPVNNAKEFIPMGGETTGITNITDEDSNAGKVYYNLNGMRVDNPQKGIYIVNGKKVIF